MTNLTAKFKFTDRGSNAVYEVSQPVVFDGEVQLSSSEILGTVRIKPDPKLEQQMMQLAACMTVAGANTRESAAQVRDMHPDYQCAAVDDVARAVDREMDLREKADEMRIEILDRDVQIEELGATIDRLDEYDNEQDKRIKVLTEAIETYTGACPEFNTLEPCLSGDCLMFRKALAGEKP
jgi:hypothetical protein